MILLQNLQHSLRRKLHLQTPVTLSRQIVSVGVQRCKPLSRVAAISAYRRNIRRGIKRTRSVLLYATAHLPKVEVQGTTINDATSSENSNQRSVDSHEQEEKVITTFRWPAGLDGHDVSVVGSFSEWKTSVSLHKSPENSDFIRSISLPPGTYQYKYLVDGEWAVSPCEAITEDGQGQFNNQRMVAASANFSWLSKWGGKEIFVTGDFTAWTELIPLEQYNEDFFLKCSLPAGTYSYQYLVDGSWMTSPDAPVAPDENGHLCNKISVDAPPAFRIYYATGWEGAALQVRELNADGQPLDQWREVPLIRSPSRAHPQGGAWFMATVPAGRVKGAQSAQKLEFYITDRAKKGVDKMLDGSHYICPGPGGYKLQQGRLQPFPRASAPPTMLVSDLDGTMVADGKEADAATGDFCNYWESNAALAGSTLVYNTGRSLGQFISLIREKSGVLALPDVLITAVGTKIFLLDHQAEGRSTAALDAWKEDLQWAKRLDHGWDLTKVKQVAGELVNELEGQEAGHWLDHGTEHPHRIALSIRADKVPSCVERLAASFKQSQVQVRIIVSGTGGWRYVDCVSIKGGKLEALEYVRNLFSIPRERCMAAGDSGNDILMLEGEIKGIIVGNAQSELVDWLLTQPQDNRIVYTDACIAHGILEGIARHGLF